MNQSILTSHNDKSWADSFKSFMHPRVITMLFFGFSAGLPILILFTPLSIWFSEAGVAKSTIGFFSWAALGYSFKFVWAPIVDALPLPFLAAWLGRRRSWLLLSQIIIAFAIIMAGLTDPLMENGLVIFAAFTVLLGFSSATQDIVIDAYRIDSAEDDLQPIMASSYIAGYRVGMLVAGAGSLIAAELLGSTKEAYLYSAWMWTYIMLACFMIVGIITTFVIKEPENKSSAFAMFKKKSDYYRFLMAFLLILAAFIAAFILSSDGIAVVKKYLIDELGFVKSLGGFLTSSLQMILAFTTAAVIGIFVWKFNIAPQDIICATYIVPFADFFTRFGKLALLLLALISLYRISDIVLGVMAYPFYLELGFSKIEIAGISKTFGLIMTLLGGFLGGLFCIRYGVIRVLLLGAILTAITNLSFALLAYLGKDISYLTMVIAVDNISAGIAGAAFVGYLTSLINKSYSASQYAILSSIMTLLPKLIAGYSGIWAENFGWEIFFIITTLIGIPVIILILLVAKFVTPKMMGLRDQQ